MPDGLSERFLDRPLTFLCIDTSVERNGTRRLVTSIAHKRAVRLTFEPFRPKRSSVSSL